MFDINTYLKNLAISHTDLQHTEDAPAFFKEYSTSRMLFDNSDFLNKMRYVKDNALVSQFNLEGGWTGPNRGQMHSYHSGAIFIISRLRDTDNGDVEAARARCHSIFKDIKAKIAYDSDNEVLPATVKFDKEMRAFPVGLIADKYYGMMYLLSYDDFNDCDNYNSAQWT